MLHLNYIPGPSRNRNPNLSLRLPNQELLCIVSTSQTPWSQLVVLLRELNFIVFYDKRNRQHSHAPLKPSIAWCRFKHTLGITSQILLKDLDSTFSTCCRLQSILPDQPPIVPWVELVRNHLQIQNQHPVLVGWLPVAEQRFIHTNTRLRAPWLSLYTTYTKLVSIAAFISQLQCQIFFESSSRDSAESNWQ